MTGLVDVHGMPLRRDVLTREVAAPTLAGVRQPEAGYPADGLTPMRLGNILRAADQGDPLAYLELAEQIEERDLHYLGVLGTRKRAVTQIEVTVEAASDDPDDVAIADMVRDWIDRDELADEMFDMLDAIGKHSSFTEIIWDRSEGQWQPARLEWRDPRFFTFDRKDGTTPLLRGGEEGNGQDTPLPPFKFIHHRVKAKSGLPMRSGLARAVAWAWMFKAYTLRDWAIFAQTYGQPVRIGKFDSNASKEDRMTLWRAVANIAGDCAAIIPQGMSIDFVESGNVGAGSDLYERRADWFDRQTSKAVLGQTGTTDTKQGGLGDGGNKVHGEVKNDIKKSDGRGLAGSLNRDLVRPWVDLERGPRKAYPRVRIEEREPEDVNGLANALDKLVDLGLEVQQSEVRDKLGLSDPDPGSKLLRPRVQAAPAIERVTSPTLSLQSAQSAVASPAAQITDRLASVTEPEMRGMLGELALMMQAATSLPELREMIVSAWPRLDAGRLVEQLAGGLTAARAAGMSDIEDADA